MKIVWASNAMLQPTGYGRIAREILPRIQNQSDHEVVQYAVSGLTHTMPMPLNGVKVYGNSSQSGNLGVRDYPFVNQMENPDIWLLNFDAWVVKQALQQMDFRYALYPPVDHDPIGADWMPVLEDTMEMVPYCRFGERVLNDVIDDAEKVREPIYHGVDVETYKPIDEASKEQVLNVDEDTFVVGIFKNNQGTRWKPVRQLRAFKLFVQENDLEDEAVLYLHSSIQGSNTFNLQAIINRLGMGDVVSLANQGQFRFGVPDQQLNVLYNACDIVMNVTSSEGFGLPIFESFATETPVIASGFSCYDEETRAVTPDGIKEYTELTAGDEIFTINPDTEEIEAKPIREIHVHDHEGEMVHYESKRLDLCVTPNHRILLNTRFDGPKQDVEEAYNTAIGLRADGAGPTAIASKTEVPKSTVENWLYCDADPTKRGERRHTDGLTYERADKTVERESFSIPLTGVWGENAEIPSPDVELNTNANTLSDGATPKDILRLLGWYIAEGSLGKDKCEDYNVVRISNGEHVEEIHEAFDALGLHSTEHPNGSVTNVRAHSKELTALCQMAGVGAENKRIPKWAKHQPPGVLEAMLDAMMKGDVASHHNTYYTVSERLAEDIAEVAIKLGYSPSIATDPSEDAEIPDGHIVKAEDCCEKFRVGISTEQTTGHIRPQSHATIEHHDGTVWCPTVEGNHNLLVERNGKFCFSGNSMPELLSGEEGEIHHDDEDVDEVMEADRGWLVPVWDKEPTKEKHSWRRTFKAEHIKRALEIAYEQPELREEKGEAARSWVSSYTWSNIASQWIDYFDSLESRLFETDESGIEWGKVETEKGGVGALGGERSDD